MLKLDLYRNNNESSTKYGRVYSRVNNAKPIDEIGLTKVCGAKSLKTVVFTMYLQILHSYISFHPLCPLFLTFPIGAKGAAGDQRPGRPLSGGVEF